MPEENQQNFDLIVLGAGPGGYVAAIKAAQLGLRTACVEKQYLGGTCLNVGCIPSKALLDSSERFHSAKHDLQSRGISVGQVKLDVAGLMKFKQDAVDKLTGGVGSLFRKNKIAHVEGHGRLAGPGKVQVTDRDGRRQTISADNVLIATGSVPNELPDLKFDGKHIISSTEALSLEKVPQKLMIIGGGYIGVEIGSVWNRLGSEVIVVEFLDRILPASDRETALALQKMLSRQGIAFHFTSIAESATIRKDKVEVVVRAREGDEKQKFLVDKVMVSVGRKPVTDDIGLESVGVSPNAKGFLEVDETFRVKGGPQGLYAIGDVIGRIMLAHNAETEGKAVAEYLAEDRQPVVNYPACPSVVYTHPELAAVGLTEEQAREKYGQEVKVGKFPLVANGRARGMGEVDGFVKVIGHSGTDRLLGVHILAARAGEMIAEPTLAMEFAASVEDLARAYHAHPTLPEAIKEAAMAADKHAIHI